MLLTLVTVAALSALGFAAFNYFHVKKMNEGTAEMSEIASAIRIGANAFINYEYKILAIVVVLTAIIMAVVTTWTGAVALVIGSVMSACAGFVGMRIATYANVRVANRARESKNLGKTLQVAFRGGSVVGLCVAGFALLGLGIVVAIFGYGMGQLSVENFTGVVNWLGVESIP